MPSIARVCRNSGAPTTSPQAWWRRSGCRVPVLLWIVVAIARAHPAGLTSAAGTFSANGDCTVRLTFDVLAAGLNDRPERVADDAMRQLLAGPRAELEARLAAARRRFERQAAVRVDGAETALPLTRFPTAADVVGAIGSAGLARLPVLLTAEFHWTLPRGRHAVEVVFPEVIGPVILSVETTGAEPFAEPVAAGRPSGMISVAVATDEGGATKPTPWARLAGYGRMGFTHIVPHGLDHILFVLGLVLLARGWRPLLAQVTAFTLAHSVTLGLALWGLVRVPAAIIEPLIALSIVAVAVDNLVAVNVRPRRVVLVFAFGLIHGLGFAGALQALGLARSEFPVALFGFNLGVELGQIAVVAAAVAALAWFRPQPQYRRWIAVPASFGIGVVAVSWTVARLAG